MSTRNRAFPRTPATILGTIVIAVQVVIPIYVDTVGDDPRRPDQYAWQMFTEFGVLPEVAIIEKSGRSRSADVARILVSPRIDIDSGEAIARHVCSTEADVASVSVVMPGSVESFEC